MRCPKPRPVRNSWEAGIFKKLSASKRVARRDRAALLARADEVIEQADMSVSETAAGIAQPRKAANEGCPRNRQNCVVGPAVGTQSNRFNNLRKGGDQKSPFEAIKLFNARSRPS